MSFIIFDYRISISVACRSALGSCYGISERFLHRYLEYLYSRIAVVVKTCLQDLLDQYSSTFHSLLFLVEISEGRLNLGQFQGLLPGSYAGCMLIFFRELTSISETSVNLYQITWHKNPRRQSTSFLSP